MYGGITVLALARRNKTLEMLQMGAVRGQPLNMGRKYRDSGRGLQGYLLISNPSITRPCGLST